MGCKELRHHKSAVKRSDGFWDDLWIKGSLTQQISNNIEDHVAAPKGKEPLHTFAKCTLHL